MNPDAAKRLADLHRLLAEEYERIASLEAGGEDGERPKRRARRPRYRPANADVSDFDVARAQEALRGGR